MISSKEALALSTKSLETVTSDIDAAIRTEAANHKRSLSHVTYMSPDLIGSLTTTLESNGYKVVTYYKLKNENDLIEFCHNSGSYFEIGNEELTVH